jgi:hypothetical protein
LIDRIPRRIGDAQIRWLRLGQQEIL